MIAARTEAGPKPAGGPEITTVPTDKLGEEANRIVRARLARAIEVVQGAGANLRLNVYPGAGGRPGRAPTLEEFTQYDKEVRGVQVELENLRTDLALIDEVIAQRPAYLAIQRLTLEAVPDERLGLLLLYSAAAASAVGAGTYSALGFPTTASPQLVPPFLAWLSALALFALSYWRLARWQAWKFELFTEKFRVRPIGAPPRTTDPVPVSGG